MMNHVTSYWRAIVTIFQQGYGPSVNSVMGYCHRVDVVEMWELRLLSVRRLAEYCHGSSTGVDVCHLGNEAFVPANVLA